MWRVVIGVGVCVSGDTRYSPKPKQKRTLYDCVSLKSENWNPPNQKNGGKVWEEDVDGDGNGTIELDWKNILFIGDGKRGRVRVRVRSLRRRHRFRKFRGGWPRHLLELRSPRHRFHRTLANLFSSYANLFFLASIHFWFFKQRFNFFFFFFILIGCPRFIMISCQI